MQIGQQIKIKEPFNTEFDLEYTIKEIDEINTYILLEELDSAFDFKYVQEI